jgi:hypothetical protein
MRIVAGVFLLVALALAVPDDREIAAAKEKLQALLDEAALLEQAGRRDEAARVRDEAAALKRKIEQGGKERDDPRAQALHDIEKAIKALDKAGYEGMASELRGMADRLRGDIKGARGQEGDFWRSNIETLRIAMKGLAEAERHDAADMVERAIHARELMLEGKPDRAERAMREAPDDGALAELLLKAAGCWREFRQPEKAAQCEELGRFLGNRMAQQRQMNEAVRKQVERRYPAREGPPPEERLARMEERLDRMERMLHDAFERLEASDREERDRERGRDGERERERDR